MTVNGGERNQNQKSPDDYFSIDFRMHWAFWGRAGVLRNVSQFVYSMALQVAVLHVRNCTCTLIKANSSCSFLTGKREGTKSIELYFPPTG